MKTGRISLATVLFVLQIRLSYAALPGQGVVWDPLADLFVSIWPQYAGNTAHLIDAILLFFIIAMTVVEVAKKTSLPNVTGWAVGIALWLAAIIPLYTQGVLLFRQPLFALLGFFITAMVFTILIKGLLEKLFGQKRKTAQWLVAAGVSLAGVGSLFSAVLSYTETNWFMDIVLSLTGLSTLAVLVGATMLFIQSGGNSTKRSQQESQAFAGLRREARKEEKNRKKLQEEQQKEQQHTKHLQALEQQFENLVDELNEHDAQEYDKMQQLQAYANSIHSYAQQFSNQLSKYRDWMDANNASLPKNYTDQLQQIVSSWSERLHSVKSLLTSLHEDREHIANKKVSRLQKALDDEFGAHDKIFEELSTLKKEISRYEHEVQELTQALQTDAQEQGIIHDIKANSLSYAKLYESTVTILKKAISIQQETDKLQERMGQDVALLVKQSRQWNEALGIFENSSKKSVENITDLQELLTTAIKEIENSIKTFKKKDASEILTTFEKFKTKIASELHEVEIRVQQEELIQKHKQDTQNLLNDFSQTYKQEILDLQNDILYTATLYTYARSLANLNKQLQEYEVSFSSKKIHDYGQELKTVHRILNEFVSETKSFTHEVATPKAQEFTKLVSQASTEILKYYKDRFQKLKGMVIDLEEEL